MYIYLFYSYIIYEDIVRISSAYTRLYYISNIVKDLASILYISKYTN